MAIRNGLVEKLLASRYPSDVFARDGLPGELKKALAERILNTEPDRHVAAERSGAGGEGPGSHRSGTSRKAVLTGRGKLDLQIPREARQAVKPTCFVKRPAARGRCSAPRLLVGHHRTPRLRTETDRLVRAVARSGRSPPLST